LSNSYPSERLLVKVINDLNDFLSYIVLVGGWIPYVYAKYIWGNIPNLAVTTTDIDFGIGFIKDYKVKESIASCVRRLRYGEHHVSMDRLIPFIPVAKDADGSMKAEVEFIADPKVPKDIKEKIVGREIKLNVIKNFNILLESIKTIKIDGHNVRIPTESMFVFHKLLTFIQRENENKLRKDLYYIYYVLRFCQERKKLVNKIKSLINSKVEGKTVIKNIHKYFNTVDSKGPFLTEQENGPDKYVDNVRQDAFDRFQNLIKYSENGKNTS